MHCVEFRPDWYASKAVVSFAEQLDVLDIGRDFGRRQRGLRVGLGEAVEAEYVRVDLAPEIGVVAFPAAQVLDDQRLGSCLLYTSPSPRDS